MDNFRFTPIMFTDEGTQEIPKIFIDNFNLTISLRVKNGRELKLCAEHVQRVFQK